MQEENNTALEYPANVIEDMGYEGLLNDLPQDYKQSFEYVLAALPDRLIKIVHERYRYGKSLKEVAEDEGVSVERIRQLVAKALTLLRNRSYNDYLVYGVKGVELRTARNTLDKSFEYAICKLTNITARLAENTPGFLKSTEEQVRNIELETPIEILDLSVRAYNCLLRAGIRTVGDILRKDYDGLMEIRNLGKKSFDEVIEKMKSYGYYISAEGSSDL